MFASDWRTGLNRFARSFAAAIGPLVSSICISTIAAETCGVRFSERLIVTGFGPVSTVHAADLDGDGDADVLFGAGRGVDEIGWYENIGDDGRSFADSSRALDTAADNPESLEAADLDGDGDLDVLSALEALDTQSKVVWYQNTGDGSFSGARVISEEVAGAHDAHAADLDGDGDLDVVSASYFDNTIAWYENLGNGDFSEQLVLTDEADGATDVHVADLDGDGDLDVLIASSGTFAWYANTGNGDFDERELSVGSSRSPIAVDTADLDGDADEDIVAAVYMEGSAVVWHENLGEGVFAEPRLVDEGVQDAARRVLAADVDGDGDEDVLSAFVNKPGVGWHETIGGQRFFGRRAIGGVRRGTLDIHASDVDGDGDYDVVASWSGVGSGQGAIAWYENSTQHCSQVAELVLRSSNSGLGPTVELARLRNSAREISVRAITSGSDGDLVVVVADSNRNELSRVVLPDPRAVRGEFFRPDGEIDESIATTLAETLTTIGYRYDTRANWLIVYKSEWNGSAFDLIELGALDLRDASATRTD